MNLLIVDDEFYVIQGILDGVRWDMLTYGNILTANNCEQAIEIFAKNQIDVLLCDIEMPGGSGLELIAWTNANSPDTECIVLTCHDDFDYARQAVKLNCLDYVLKPASYDLLGDVLKKAGSVLRDKRSQSLYSNYGKIYVQNMTNQAAEEMTEEDIVEQVAKYINEHIADSLMIEELARMVHVSHNHLTRSFKKRFNQTVIDYINKQRMIMAGELLKDSKASISMVSDWVGFDNYSYFTKQFKKYYGKTPREYQAEHIHKAY